MLGGTKYLQKFHITLEVLRQFQKLILRQVGFQLWTSEFIIESQIHSQFDIIRNFQQVSGLEQP